MATELTKTKRKRTAKKNIVLNNIIPECEAIVAKEKSNETITEALVLLQALSEAINEVSSLDDMVSNLIDDDNELEKNEEDAYKL